jgi:hypothetical protein
MQAAKRCAEFKVQFVIHHHFVWMVGGIHLLHIHGNQFLPSFCIDPSSYQGPTQSEKFHASLLHQIHIHRNKEALI